MNQLPVQPNRSVLEGIEVLLAVARSGKPVRVRALAREFGVTPTRLQRYLATLAHGGLLRQLPDRSYTTGAGMHALSAISMTASGLAPRALKILPQLADLGCIVALGVLWRDRVSYLYFQHPDQHASGALGRVADFPAHDSSIGHILLATNGAVARTGPLQTQLAATLQRGYARIDREDGETSIAVPVGSPPMAGLALSGHFDRRRVPQLVSRLREVAGQLAADTVSTTN
jgi:DNA-binding IclR family transcriptional regulator